MEQLQPPCDAKALQMFLKKQDFALANNNSACLSSGRAVIGGHLTAFSACLAGECLRAGCQHRIPGTRHAVQLLTCAGAGIKPGAVGEDPPSAQGVLCSALMAYHSVASSSPGGLCKCWSGSSQQSAQTVSSADKAMTQCKLCREGRPTIKWHCACPP